MPFQHGVEHFLHGRIEGPELNACLMLSRAELETALGEISRHSPLALLERQRGRILDCVDYVRRRNLHPLTELRDRVGAKKRNDDPVLRQTRLARTLRSKRGPE